MDVDQFIILEAQVERLLLSHDRLKRDNKQLKTEIKQLQTEIGQLQSDVSVRERRITGLQNTRERLTQLRAIVLDLQQERFVVHKKLQELLQIVEQLENSLRGVRQASVASHLYLRARGVGVWQFAAHDASTRFKCPYPKI